MNPSYEAGMPLEVRGERWTLARVQMFGACTVLTLGGADRTNAARTLRVVTPFDRPRRVDRKLRRRPRRAVIRAALGALVSARAATGLWTAAESPIEVWPYQLEPALAAISGATRLLLADAVGLGKTIQAGLVLSELMARGWIERALVVCPAGLRDTWAHELKERFRLAAAIVDQPSIAERLATIPPGVNPWCSAAITIASIDFIKRPEVLAAVDRAPIDILIADEAHHLAPGTDRGSAIARLARRVPWVVLISATPHSGDAAAFGYLTGIGAHDDALAIFRRDRRDAGLEVARRSHVLPVTPTDRERALFDAVDRYVRALWRAPGTGESAVRLVAITIARRAASSTAALARTLERRLALLSGQPVEPSQAALPWEEPDHSDDLDDDLVLATRGLESSADERSLIEQLVSLAGACTAASKMQRLVRLLHASREPAIVFTEYRDTLDAILERVPPSRRAGAIHGGLPADARVHLVDAFNDGRLDLLIATDAAGEGLNLHHRCRLVIDFELPWNPLRLEQRAGRVDRIGQRRRVHVIRMFHPGTIEARVLDQLRVRRGRADAALERRVTETEVAAAIFEERELPPMTAPRPRRDVASAAAEEALRIISRRRARACGATPATTCWDASRRSDDLVLLHRSTFTNDHGSPIADRVEAHHVALTGTPANRREWRHAIERISRLIQAQAIAPLLPQRAQGALESRIAAIRVRLSQEKAVEYQRSLFDDRAEAHALERETTFAAIDAALARVLDGVRTPATPLARTELVAAWTWRR